MPDMINNLFGRSRNDIAMPNGSQTAEASVAVAPEASDSAAIAVEQTETEWVETTGDAADSETTSGTADTAESGGTVESDDYVADTDQSDAADDPIKVDDAVAGDAPSDTATDDSDQPAAAEDAAEIADDDSGPADELEPGTTDTEADPATDSDTDTDTETDTETAEEAESVAASEDEPVAADSIDADDADDAEQATGEDQPVAEPAPAETRAAAGTRGTTTVGDGVVAKIVQLTAGKVEGVHRLDDEGMLVEADGDVAMVKVAIVVEYGHAIKALAEQIRIDVIEAVEQFLGLDVASVDVHVTDIHLPTAA